MKQSARYCAVSLLERTLETHGYSNLLLDTALSEAELLPEEKRLCARLYYGVMERLLTLEYIVRCYSKRPPEKLDLSVLCILYTGLYQLLYCDWIPDRAAVHESVLLTRQFRKSSASGMVNAVLRNFQRDEKQIRMPEDSLMAMQVQYSAPKVFIERLIAEHGRAWTEQFLENSLQPPPLTIRFNPLRGDVQAMEQEGLAPYACDKVEHAYYITCSDVRSSPAFQQGMFHVQDLASQLCCAVLDPRSGETVLDVCAAPGGKSFTIAQRMQDTGAVYAFDLHEHRVKLIAEGAGRLGLTCIHAQVQDAAVYHPQMPAADRVLCDVPCSGYGVIRRKPEIKYKSLQEAAELPALQYEILEQAAGFLKAGGTLVYSTCTILNAENKAVVQKFLEHHPEFEPVPLTEFGIAEAWKTLSVQDADCDGFFVARLRRRRNT